MIMARDHRVLWAMMLALAAAGTSALVSWAAETGDKSAKTSAASKSADTVSANKPADIGPEVQKILRALADSHSGAKSTRKSVTATVRVRAKGAGSAHTATYTVTSAQPNKLAMIAKGSKEAPAVVSDGQELTVQLPAAGKFVVDKAPATFDKFLATDALRGTGANNPMLVGMMLDLLPADALLARLSAAEDLGEAKVGSTKCHHLLLSMGAIDYELWIDTGDRPKLRKVVPKLDRWLADHGDGFPNDAKVEMTLVFKNWATDVKLTDAAFKFTPLEGLSQVASFSGTSGGEKEGPELLLNKPAPRFELALAAGGSMNLAAHKNKDVVIIDFWATWCGPCVKSLPIISEVAASYKSKGVVLYAVNLKQGPDDILPFLQEKQLPITVAMDSTGSVSDMYKVSGIPTTILIGKDGIVQQVHVGLAGDLKERLSKELDTLLAGKSIARASE